MQEKKKKEAEAYGVLGLVQFWLAWLGLADQLLG